MMNKNSNVNQTTHPTRECKCKLLPLSLSATTVAEFGDLASLQHRISTSKYKNYERQRTSRLLHHPPVVNTKNPTKNDDNNILNESDTSSRSNSNIISITNNTSTPLHLAAQNGHTAITSYLLQNGYDTDTGLLRSSLSTIMMNDDGNSQSSIILQQRKLCTPLHRACHSGSLSCIKLLLDYGANDMAIDYSMNDGMTPLHKTIKGGRYLALTLLLDHLKNKDLNHGRSNNNDKQTFLMEALEARDTMNRKPLDLALELQSHGEEEIRSVRRWDSVAGGEANWDYCVSLLYDAIKQCAESDNHPITTTRSYTQGKVSSNVFDIQDNMSPICDCDESGDDQCKTLVWEAAFQSALLQSTKALLKEKSLSTINVGTQNEQNEPNDQIMVHTNSIDENDLTEKRDNTTSDCKPRNEQTTMNLGVTCASCGLKTISLFRFKDNHLFCKKCIKLVKRRSCVN